MSRDYLLSVLEFVSIIYYLVGNVEKRFVLLSYICFNFRYAQFWKGCLTLYTGKGGDICKIGE